MFPAMAYSDFQARMKFRKLSEDSEQPEKENRSQYVMSCFVNHSKRALELQPHSRLEPTHSY